MVGDVIVVAWIDRRQALGGARREDLSLASVRVTASGLMIQQREVGGGPAGVIARTPTLALTSTALAVGGQYQSAAATDPDGGPGATWLAVGGNPDGGLWDLFDLGPQAGPPHLAGVLNTFVGAYQRGSHLVLAASLDGGPWAATSVDAGLTGAPRLAIIGPDAHLAAAVDGFIAVGRVAEWFGARGPNHRFDGGELVDLIRLPSGAPLVVYRTDGGTVLVDIDRSVSTDVDARLDSITPFAEGALAFGLQQGMLVTFRYRDGGLGPAMRWNSGQVLGLSGNDERAVVVEQDGRGLSLRLVLPRPQGGLEVASGSTRLTEAPGAQRRPSAMWDRSLERFVLAWDAEAFDPAWTSGAATVSLEGVVAPIVPSVDNAPVTGGTFVRLHVAPDGAQAFSRNFAPGWSLQTLGPGLQPIEAELQLPSGDWHASFAPRGSIAWRARGPLGAEVARSFDGVSPQVGLVAGVVGRCAAVLADEHWLPVWRNAGLEFEVFMADGSRDTIDTAVQPAPGSVCATRVDDSHLVATWVRSPVSVQLALFRRTGGSTPGLELEAQVQLPTVAPLDPVAAAVPGGTIMAWSADAGERLEAAFVPADGGLPRLVVLTSQRALLGAPTLAAAPSGDALVAWHEFDHRAGAFSVAARLLRLAPGPFDAGTDGGAPDAGPIEPTPAAPAIVFNPVSCGCTEGPGPALLITLLLVAARRRREPPTRARR